MKTKKKIARFNDCASAQEKCVTLNTRSPGKAVVENCRHGISFRADCACVSNGNSNPYPRHPSQLKVTRQPWNFAVLQFSYPNTPFP